ncbi:MAG: hypothetical protein WKG01_38170 [Kofleriaceae bacterium]
MIRVLFASLGLAALVSGCRISLDEEAQESTVCKVSTTNADCQAAPDHSELAWIEANVFEKSCTFSGCHNGMATDAGRLNLKVGQAHQSLVDVDSDVEPGRKLVVANQPLQSYLLVMLRQVTPAMADPPVGEPPDDVGYMPQNAGGAVLCCQKLDAIQRWIEAGALNN